MNETLLHLGVGGIFALLILKEVFNFIKKKDNRSTCSCCDGLKSIKELVVKDHQEHDKIIEEVLVKTRELWHWHSIEEPGTGVKVWYTGNLKSKISDLATAVIKLQQTTSDLQKLLKEK